jgi:uncharacterized membrane protein YbhN (UPF0104 family)
VSPPRWIRPLLGLAVTVVFVALVARQVTAQDWLAAFAGASAGLVALALAAYTGAFACRIARWRAMLALDNPRIGWWQCGGPLLAGFALNNVLPLRAGDVARALAFGTRLGSSAGRVTATLFVERLLDLLMLLVAAGAALWVFGDRVAGPLARLGGGGVLLLAAAVALLLLVPRLSAAAVRALLALLARPLPALAARLRPEAEHGLASLHALSRGGVMRALLAWSALCWALEGLTFWLVARALPSLELPAAAWLAFPVATLSTLVPSSPGYVGTFDFFAAQAMQALGNASAPAAAFAVLVHALIWLPVTVVGLACLWAVPLERPLFTKDAHASAA